MQKKKLGNFGLDSFGRLFGEESTDEEQEGEEWRNEKWEREREREREKPFQKERQSRSRHSESRESDCSTTSGVSRQVAARLRPPVDGRSLAVSPLSPRLVCVDRRMSLNQVHQLTSQIECHFTLATPSTLILILIHFYLISLKQKTTCWNKKLGNLSNKTTRRIWLEADGDLHFFFGVGPPSSCVPAPLGGRSVAQQQHQPPSASCLGPAVCCEWQCLR